MSLIESRAKRTMTLRQSRTVKVDAEKKWKMSNANCVRFEWH